MSYHLVGKKTKRREYLSENQSPLYSNFDFPTLNLGQKSSYHSFLNEKLPQLLNFYFPVEVSDFVSKMKFEIKKIRTVEPKISREEARNDFLTWSQTIFLTLNIFWEHKKVKISLDPNLSLAENISEWVKKSFKIGEFICRKKSEEEWEIKEKKEDLKLELKILEIEEDNLKASFLLNRSKEVKFCDFPKIDEQGRFLINGNNILIVFQSVRAPGIYHLNDKNNLENLITEFIPLKGAWFVVFCDDKKNSREVWLKFLNSKVKINSLEIFKSFLVPLETLKSLFDEKELDLKNYEKESKNEDINKRIPQFLFSEENSYFNPGIIGRRRMEEKFWSQIKEKTLAENIVSKNGKIILKKDSLLEKNNLKILKDSFDNKEIKTFSIPNSAEKLCSLKIKSPSDFNKTCSVIFGNWNNPNKNYFDLADLICLISCHINLHHGLEEIKKESSKDDLANQIFLCVGDLLFRAIDSKMGSFLQYIKTKFLAKANNLAKIDLLKIPFLEREISKVIREIFNVSRLRQIVDENPLTEISYGRRVSLVGRGGFKGGRLGSNIPLESRNNHPSFYGNYDLIDTPEGQNVSLVRNLTLGSRINELGEITSPYRAVKNGVITEDISYLNVEEVDKKRIANFQASVNSNNELLGKEIPVRYQRKFIIVSPQEVDYIDATPYHLNSVTSSSIPFFHYNDPTRLLMATHMYKQAIPLIKGEQPLVASGNENFVFENSSLTLKASEKGEVIYVDYEKIIIKNQKERKIEYKLNQQVVTNILIMNFSVPRVKKGEFVEKNQIIAGGHYAQNDELSLGLNLRAAYCFQKDNYEDAYIISQKLSERKELSTIFVRERDYTITFNNTKEGPEISSFPSFYKKKPYHLDEDSIVKVGSRVEEGDILVGKLTPTSKNKKKEATARNISQSLIEKILGKKIDDFYDSSLYVRKGEEGIVYKVIVKNDEGLKKLRIFEEEEKKIEEEIEKIKKGKNKSEEKKIEELNKKLKEILTQKKKIKELKTLVVSLAEKRSLKIGDKLVTRFGNKGVVAKIIPQAGMPYDKEGKPFDIIFNPLSIPTRMNIGQLMETLVAKAAHNLNTGFLIRPFNNLKIEDIKEILDEAKIKNFGNEKLFDGKTGEYFDRDIFCGYVYVMKLNHMAKDKIHARSGGGKDFPYALIHQQPLKGRSKGGGQKLGKMEIDALVAHGAAYTLAEKIGAGSDGIKERKELYFQLLHGTNREINLKNTNTESFNLLLQYLRGIGFDLEAVDYQGRKIDFYKEFTKNIKEK